LSFLHNILLKLTTFEAKFHGRRQDVEKQEFGDIFTPISTRFEKRDVIMSSIEKPVAIARGAANGIGLGITAALLEHGHGE
jgi:hypothetical protein